MTKLMSLGVALALGASSSLVGGFPLLSLNEALNPYARMTAHTDVQGDDSAVRAGLGGTRADPMHDPY